MSSIAPPAGNTTFQPINTGYNRVFRSQRMSLGLVVPLEEYERHPVPTMTRHLERVKLAEELGFAAVWLRDVPFNVPNFGDAGQLFDPFVYLGFLAAQTERIALATANGKYFDNDSKQFTNPHPDALSDEKVETVVTALLPAEVPEE